MNEETEKEYKEYLYKQLDLIFKPGIKKSIPDFHRTKDDDFEAVSVQTDSGEKYVFKNKITNKIICPPVYDVVCPFKNGFARVGIKDKAFKDIDWNYIDYNGNELYKNGYFNEARDFSDGFAAVRGHHHHFYEWNFLNTKGTFIDGAKEDVNSETWYPHVSDFSDGKAIVAKIQVPGHPSVPITAMWSYIDETGQRIGNWKLVTDYSAGRAFISEKDVFKNNILRNRLFKTVTKDLKDYEVKRVFGGYRCSNREDTFTIKHSPFLIFDLRYVLCVNKNTIYLFDRKTNKYKELGKRNNVFFNRNMIFDINKDTVSFVYEGNIYDITEYYTEKLKGDGYSEVNSGIEILTKEDFFIEREKKIRTEVERARKAQELAEKEANKTEEERRLEAIRQKHIKEQKSNEIIYGEAINYINKGLTKLEEYAKKTGIVERVKISNVFRIVNDHYEIYQELLESGKLRHIDLSDISFKNVKISGIDFSYCNISFNPQEVYNKDLSNSNFEGIFFPVSTNFTDVNICGAKFTNDNKGITFDLNEQTLANAIYDETTTLNGIPLTELLNTKEKSGK